jgi:hypothetical protein
MRIVGLSTPSVFRKTKITNNCQKLVPIIIIGLNFRELKWGIKMEEDEKTRRQGDETNVMISRRNVSISNVLYSCIPIFQPPSA